MLCNKFDIKWCFASGPLFQIDLHFTLNELHYLHKFAAGSMRIANSNFRSTFRNFRKFSKIAANFNKAVVINLWLYREFLQIHVTLHSAIGMQPTSTSPIRSARFRETYKRYFDTISPRYFPNRIERCKIDKRGAARRGARRGLRFFLESPYHFSSIVSFTRMRKNVTRACPQIWNTDSCRQLTY